VSDIDYPGMKDCPDCGGEGVILVPREEHFGKQRVVHPPTYRRCLCVLQKDILANVERGMGGLSKARKVPESPLMPLFAENLWLTASKPWFMAHLRHVAIRRPPSWYFKVVTDAELMSAWLASVAVDGKEIMDPDAQTLSITHLRLEDLVLPPELLIVRVGVKAARNVATPEVLLETLNLREHANLPTWVWDQPGAGWELAEGHISYSTQVEDHMDNWVHHRVEGKAEPDTAPQTTGGGRPATGDFDMPAPKRRATTLSGAADRKRGGKK